MIELRGIIPALATPLRIDGSFDEAGCRNLIEHVIAGGVHGVLALGSTGEIAALDEHTRRQIVETVAAAVNGRVPIIIGVAQINQAEALGEIAAGAAFGARAALVLPPFYSPIDQGTVVNFYRGLAERSALPILVYNIPHFTKVVVQPATLAQLAAAGAIAGLKDSSRDFEYFEEVTALTEEHPDLLVFQGVDTMLLASLAMGATGAITLSSNLVPAWGVRLYETISAGRWEDARAQQHQLLRLIMALRTGNFPAGIKTALSLAGVCGDTMAFPVPGLSSAERATLEAKLRDLGVLGKTDEGKEPPASRAAVTASSSSPY